MFSDGGESDDGALLAELANLLRAEIEPPPALVEVARSLFAWRPVDAELATLTFDSVFDEDPVLVRAAARPRILTFAAGALTIEAEVDAGPAGRRLLGQLVPAQAAELELRTPDGPVRGSADEHGWFAIVLPATRRPVSLRCRLADGSTVDAAWVLA